jgi:hypothetical protein
MVSSFSEFVWHQPRVRAELKMHLPPKWQCHWARGRDLPGSSSVLTRQALGTQSTRPLHGSCPWLDVSFQVPIFVDTKDKAESLRVLIYVPTPSLDFLLCSPWRELSKMQINHASSWCLFSTYYVPDSGIEHAISPIPSAFASAFGGGYNVIDKALGADSIETCISPEWLSS